MKCTRTVKTRWCAGQGPIVFPIWTTYKGSHEPPAKLPCDAQMALGAARRGSAFVLRLLPLAVRA